MWMRECVSGPSASACHLYPVLLFLKICSASIGHYGILIFNRPLRPPKSGACWNGRNGRS